MFLFEFKIFILLLLNKSLKCIEKSVIFTVLKFIKSILLVDNSKNVINRNLMKSYFNIYY